MAEAGRSMPILGSEYSYNTQADNEDQRRFAKGVRATSRRSHCTTAACRASYRCAARFTSCKSILHDSAETQEQKQTLLRLSGEIPALKQQLSRVAAVNQSCLEAKVEENDYTVLTLDDLEYELELAEVGIRKKIAFVENQVRQKRFQGERLNPGQMVSATHTNVTPAKLEEFEATFKHFDKDDTNVSC